MKKFKTLFVILTSIIIMFGFAGCDNNENKIFLVNLDSGCGYIISMTDITYGSKIIEPTEPTKSGYKFLGWYLGDEKWNFEESVVTSDITLKAHWEKEEIKIQKWTVQFDSDGGSAVSSLTEIASGTKITEPTEPIKSGYKFLGWYLGDAKWNFEESVVTNHIILKAHWEQLWTVQFDSDGGSVVSCLTGIITGTKIAEPTEPTKSGNKFLGWYLGDEKWNFLDNTITQNIILKAKWESIVFTINEANNELLGLTEYGKTLTNLEIPGVINGVEIKKINEEAFKII